MLVLFVILIGFIFIMAAAAIDYSLWLSQRRGIARASDMAALAATFDLPADPTTSGPFNSEGVCYAPSQQPSSISDACIAAFQWASRNGYDEDTDPDIQVNVNFFCGNDLPSGVVNAINSHNTNNTVCYNTNSKNSDECAPNGCWPYLSPCPDAPNSGETGCDAVNVTIEKPAIKLFSTFFGGGMDFNVGFSSWGSVTFKLIPTDSVLAIDESGSMSGGCNAQRNNSGCKIFEAKTGANNFVDFLVNGSPITLVGFTPFRDCYDPPLVGGSNCVPAMDITGPNRFVNCDTPPPTSQIKCLNSSGAYTHQGINLVTPASSTNVCYGLFEERDILNGPGNQTGNPDTKRFAVILTDGDNQWNNSTGAQTPGACRPANTAGGGGVCTNSNQSERDLDVKTMQLATAMKNAVPPIEIYVVGLTNNCGVNNVSQTATAGYCAGIGDAAADSTADRRLMKCIASSTPGTNDHYFETTDATQLGDIFQLVALEIAGRGLTVLPPP